jgi:LAO/AO transport system kinase
VVSKCDRRDAHRTLADLKQMLTLGPHTAPRSEWQVPVVGTSAVTGEGIERLVTIISQHRHLALGTALGAARRRRVAEYRLTKTAEDLLLERFHQNKTGGLASFLLPLADRKTDPYTAAVSILASFTHQQGTS